MEVWLAAFIQFLVAAATACVALTIVLRADHCNELALARNGNMAAAIWIGGTALAMATAVAPAVWNAQGAVHLAFLAAFASIIQLGGYFAVVRYVAPKRQVIQANNVAGASLVVALQLAIAVLVAAILSS